MSTSSAPRSNALPLENLRARADLVERVRGFLRARGMLEVETPILGRGGVSDPHLEPFATRLHFEECGDEPLFLQTSPEVFMKRLLSAGAGPIFQIARAFRNGEVGPRHNPEFTILEWYRPGFDEAALREEVEALVRDVLGCPAAETLEYEDLFRERAGVNPFEADARALLGACRRLEVDVPAGPTEEDPDALQDLLLALVLEPELGRERPTFVTGYPAHRAALAASRRGDPRKAARFELFVEGLELANGFEELTDPDEQQARFGELNHRRAMAGQQPLPIDAAFLENLAEMPPTAGVALGFDRLVMLALGVRSLAEVVAFPYARL